MRLVVLVLSSLLALGVALSVSWPALSAHGQVAGGPSQAVSLPWRFPAVGAKNVLSVKLDGGWWAPQVWRVVPDDELTAMHVNGTAVPLDGIPLSRRKDYRRGFTIDLGKYLVRGPNEMVFEVDNTAYGGGLEVRPVLGPIRWGLIGAAFVPLLLAFAQLFRLRRVQTRVIACALIPLLCYWGRTPWHVRGHDVGGNDGHLGYIVYIAEHGAVPDPTAGWTFYHPPLYYAVAALVVRAAARLGVSVPECLQALALAFWLVFLTASAGAIGVAIRERRSRLIATIALAFWPSGVMHAVRIGNDLPLFAAAGVATWFMIRWWRHGRRVDLWGLSGFTALAMMCKSNGAVLVVAVALLVMLRPFFGRNHRSVVTAARDFAIAIGSALLGAGLDIGLRANYYLHAPREKWLIGNGSMLNPALRVPADAAHILLLDVRTYFQQPWLDTMNDATGRGSFWNFVLRSSLSGEFQFEGALSRTISLTWGVVLAALCILGGYRIARRLGDWRRILQRELPWIVLAFAWLASLMALRIQLPFACSNDFRYVLPVLVSAIVWWTRSGRIAQTLLLFVSALSAMFFATLS